MRTSKPPLTSALLIASLFFLHSALIQLRADVVPPAQQSASPEAFYYSFIYAIESAYANGRINLNEGFWKTAANNIQVLWEIPPSETADFIFHYEAANISDATITFKPKPIRIRIKGVPGYFDITKLHYDNFGDLQTDSTIVSNVGQPINIAQFDKLKDNLEMVTEVGRNFTGTIFAHGDDAIPSDSNWNEAGPAGSMIARIRLRPAPGQPDALDVSLFDHAKVRLSQSNPKNVDAQGNQRCYDNYFVVKAGTKISVLNLDYSNDAGNFDMRVGDIKVALYEGRIGAGDVQINLTDNSKLMLHGIECHFQEGVRTIQTDPEGIVDAGVGDASVFAISSSPHAILTTGLGSHVTLTGFQLTIKDDVGTRLEIGNGSSATLVVSSGQLPIATNGWVAIRNSSVSMTFTNAVWTSGAKPNVAGTIDKLDSVLTGGEFWINDASHLLIGGGSIAGTKLLFNSLNAQPLTGTFETVSLQIKEGSLIEVAGGLRLVSKDGSFQTAQPNQFSILVGQDFPFGSFKFRLPFRELKNDKFGIFGITDGNMELVLLSNEKGLFSSDSDAFFANGTLTIATGQLGTFSTQLSLTKCKLAAPKGGAVHFESSVALTIPKGTGSSFPVTGSYPDIPIVHDDTAFGFNLSAALAGDLVIQDVPISFDSGKISILPQVFTPNLLITIPKGRGEHQNSKLDDVPAGGGPDNCKDKQEVFTAELTGSGPRKHFYINDATYTFTSRFTLGLSNQGLAINISDLNTADNVALTEDGTDFDEILTGLGVLLGGPLGAIPGHLVGQKAADKVREIAYRKMYDAIHNFSKDWTIKL